jgi:hypothetical protein
MIDFSCILKRSLEESEDKEQDLLCLDAELTR